MDWLKEHVLETGHTIDIQQTLVTLAFATIYSYVVALGYRRTYSGKKYSANFAHSIILLGVLISIVIAIIGNSVARAFGVAGALSVIRYRVPINDPKDIVYVLGSVVVGLACGVQEYPEAGLATVVFVFLAWVLHAAPLGLDAPPEEPEPPEPADDGEKKKKKHKHHDETPAPAPVAAIGEVPTPSPAVLPTPEPANEDEEHHKHKKHKHKKHDKE